MNVDVKEFSKECSCGQDHEVFVKDILIERDALLQLPDLLKREDYKNYHSPLIICDNNTYNAAGKKVEQLVSNSKILILESKGLHADNHGVQVVMENLTEDIDLLLAVGSGTIHDLTRYAAAKQHIPFISIPTAASVDGFVSTIAAMTWDGLKQTFSAVSPICVIADSNIFSKAPYRLTASGISDLLGKYSALVDWRISHLITGEYICDRVVDLELEAISKVCECVDSLKNGEVDAYEQLMYALILSGLAMQMVGNSRPASGAEHHISHLWEMEILNDTLDAYHGEKVSVGLVLTIDLYHRVATCIHNGSVKVKAYEGLEDELIRETFGKKGLYEGIIKENTPDPLLQVDLSVLANKLEEIANMLDELPSTLQLNHILTYAGCVKKMKEIGLDKSLLGKTIQLSPYVRNRLTFMRILKLLDITEDGILDCLPV